MGGGGEGLWKISPQERQGVSGKEAGGGGVNQKVSVWTALDDSLRNGSLYCCVYVLITHFHGNTNSFSIHYKPDHTDIPSISKNLFVNSVFHL